MTVKAPRVKLGHPNKFKGQTEAFGDSDRGIRYFARQGCKRVDGNGLLSEDKIPMAAHWPKFLRHGFVFIDGRGTRTIRDRGINYYTARELVSQFHTRRGHYRISRTIDQIKLAFSLGMDYEFEVKCWMDQKMADSLRIQVAILQKHYPDRKVIVKVYNNRQGKAMWLKPFKLAGFPTLITTHTPFRATDVKAEQYADEYRGFHPRWV